MTTDDDSGKRVITIDDAPDFCNLPTRISRALLDAGLTTGGMVRRMTSHRLSLLPGIGLHGVKVLRTHFPYLPPPDQPAEPAPPDPVVERLDRIIALLELIADGHRDSGFSEGKKT